MHYCLFSAALVFPLIFPSLTHSKNPIFIEIVACVSISIPNFRAVFEETAVSGVICIGSVSCDSVLPQWKNRLGLKQSVGCSASVEVSPRGQDTGSGPAQWLSGGGVVRESLAAKRVLGLGTRAREPIRAAATLMPASSRKVARHRSCPSGLRLLNRAGSSLDLF